MIKITIYRHGETSWNKKSLIQGHTDIPLNLNGLGQALVLSNKLKDRNFDLVLSSDLSRAHQTARVVMKKQKDATPFILSKNLREINFGDAEGTTYDTFLSKYKDILNVLDNISHDLTYDTPLPNGETHRQLINRFLQCLEDNLNRHPNSRNVAIFAHGGVMRVLTKFLKNEIKSFKNTEELEVYYHLDTGKLTLN